MIHNVFSILIALGVLITFHEFGHYYVARRCGVKVLRFSVGFGKPILSFKNKAGTEFTLALIPLGGFVRMLDEREGSVPDSLKSQAFNNKPVWQRIAIVAAGPFANFILAIVFYWFVALMGIQSIAPVVGETLPGSPAQHSNLQNGDELVAINGRSVHSWEQVNLALAQWIGESGEVRIRYRPEGRQSFEEDVVSLNAWLKGEEPNNLIQSFGIQPKKPVLDAVIDQVVPGQAAEAAGFLPGDHIVRVGDTEIPDWSAFVAVVQASPGKTLEVLVQRGAQESQLFLTPGSHQQGERLIGFAGLAPSQEKWLRTAEYGIFDGMVYGVQQTWTMTYLTLSSIGKMVRGLLSLDNLSGPITIAKVASTTAESGIQSFLKFLAYLSVSLGVLNLLPIPVLDGGHLLFYVIEAVRGRAVPDKIQFLAYRIGAAFLFGLMAIAIFNDVSRL